MACNIKTTRENHGGCKCISYILKKKKNGNAVFAQQSKLFWRTRRAPGQLVTVPSGVQQPLFRDKGPTFPEESGCRTQYWVWQRYHRKKKKLTLCSNK